MAARAARHGGRPRNDRSFANEVLYLNIFPPCGGEHHTPPRGMRLVLQSGGSLSSAGTSGLTVSSVRKMEGRFVDLCVLHGSSAKCVGDEMGEVVARRSSRSSQRGIVWVVPPASHAPSAGRGEW